MKVCLKPLLITLFFSCNNVQENKGNAPANPDSSSKNKTSDTAGKATLQHSMKGFDLYVWKKGATIFYTLLPGTNRKKTAAEIYDSKNAVEGMNAIKNKLNGIAPGEYIFLKPVDMDTNELKPLKEYIRNKGLNLTIIQ